ncbi:MAG: protein kinase, partial [Clostridia bacterium]|nr:protein kinase [Clostridia bacterium]
MLEFEPLWGSWYLEKAIGAGSYGTVYKARQEVLGHTYYSAIKHISIPRDEVELNTMKEELATEDDETLRSYYDREVSSLVDEFDIQKRFSGKDHFVLIHDILAIRKKEMPGYDLFMRMELLDSIHKRFQTVQDAEQETIRLGTHICMALSEMHRMHYLHRDIKPQNILVSKDGTYKLADFGTARKLAGNASFLSMKGTLDYIAPEIINGHATGYTSDLYSLGLVLYRQLNGGRLPFVEKGIYSEEEKSSAVLKRIAGETFPPPSEASPAMAAIILKACAYKAEDRYSSADEMLQALQNIRNSADSSLQIEIQKLKAEIHACSLRIGEKDTGDLIQAIISKASSFPQDRPEVRDCIDSARRLATAHEDAVARANESAQLDRLSLEIEQCSKKADRTETKEKVQTLLETLKTMDQSKPEVQMLIQKCNNLLASMEKSKKRRNIFPAVVISLLACFAFFYIFQNSSDIGNRNLISSSATATPVVTQSDSMSTSVEKPTATPKPTA